MRLLQNIGVELETLVLMRASGWIRKCVCATIFYKDSSLQPTSNLNSTSRCAHIITPQTPDVYAFPRRRSPFARASVHSALAFNERKWLEKKQRSLHLDSTPAAHTTLGYYQGEESLITDGDREGETERKREYVSSRWNDGEKRDRQRMRREVMWRSNGRFL